MSAIIAFGGATRVWVDSDSAGEIGLEDVVIIARLGYFELFWLIFVMNNVSSVVESSSLIAWIVSAAVSAALGICLLILWCFPMFILSA